MTVKDKVEQIKIVEAKEKNKVTSNIPTHVEAKEEAMKAIYQLDKAKFKKAAPQCRARLV